MLKAYKFRLYPNQKQEKIIIQILGNARFVYNHCLFLKNEKYKDGKQNFSYSDMSKHITDFKKYQEYAWLKIGDSIAIQQSLRDLDQAFQRFFKKQAKYPRFHSKHKKNSYRTINQIAVGHTESINAYREQVRRKKDNEVVPHVA